MMLYGGTPMLSGAVYDEHRVQNTDKVRPKAWFLVKTEKIRGHSKSTSDLNRLRYQTVFVSRMAAIFIKQNAIPSGHGW